MTQPLPNSPYTPHTFFVSRQHSTIPLTDKMTNFISYLSNLTIPADTNITLSAQYGKRMLITQDHINPKTINRDDIIEIVDYDPIKKITMAIGKTNPTLHTPVHWLIHNALTDIHVILQLDNADYLEQYTDQCPMTDNKAPPGTIDAAKEILPKLRDHTIILVQDQGILIVGINLDTIKKQVTQLFKKEEEKL